MYRLNSRLSSADGEGASKCSRESLPRKRRHRPQQQLLRLQGGLIYPGMVHLRPLDRQQWSILTCMACQWPIPELITSIRQLSRELQLGSTARMLFYRPKVTVLNLLHQGMSLLWFLLLKTKQARLVLFLSAKLKTK
jgi:hypothetical protein